MSLGLGTITVPRVTMCGPLGGGGGGVCGPGLGTRPPVPCSVSEIATCKPKIAVHESERLLQAGADPTDTVRARGADPHAVHGYRSC